MGVRAARVWGISPIGANGGICCGQRINKKAPALSPGAFTQSPSLLALVTRLTRLRRAASADTGDEKGKQEAQREGANEQAAAD
jgi:hypothetical protein